MHAIASHSDTTQGGDGVIGSSLTETPPPGGDWPAHISRRAVQGGPIAGHTRNDPYISCIHHMQSSRRGSNTPTNSAHHEAEVTRLIRDITEAYFCGTFAVRVHALSEGELRACRLCAETGAVKTGAA